MSDDIPNNILNKATATVQKAFKQMSIELDAREPHDWIPAWLAAIALSRYYEDCMIAYIQSIADKSDLDRSATDDIEHMRQCFEDMYGSPAQRVKDFARMMNH